MHHTAIIIPAHNEENCIGHCIQSLSDFQQKGNVIVVVDAKSVDQTAETAQSFAVHVMQSKTPERGFATAEGIRYIYQHYPECEYIIIAHADMRFQPNSCSIFHDAVKKNPNAVWGSFGNTITPSTFGYKIISIGNNIRARYFHFPYGDQAQFFRMDVLQQIGFPNQAALEDLELCYRFKPQRRYLYLNHPVLIPDRHWQKLGIVRTTLRNWKTVWRYRKNRNNPNFSYNAGYQ